MQLKSALTRLGRSNAPLAVVDIDFPDPSDPSDPSDLSDLSDPSDDLFP